MHLKVLVAEAREVLRVGLCSILASDTRVAEVYEMVNEKELLSVLSTFKPDLIIVNQALVSDLSILQTQNFLVLASVPDITTLKAAYEYGARGYLSVNISAELLCSQLRPAENAFLVEPTLVPQLMDSLFQRKTSRLVNNALLTPREREIVHLLRSGYDKNSIATKLSIAEPTLKTHLKNIARKRAVAMQIKAK